MEHVIELAGCRAAPLDSYLKSLGLFRVVAEQADPAARCDWRHGRLRLHSRLDAQALQAFLLHDYVPTPILSPWSGRAGFLEAEDGSRKGPQLLRALLRGKAERFSSYRRFVETTRRIPVVAELRDARIREKELKDQIKQSQRSGQDPSEFRRELKELEGRSQRLKAQLIGALRAELPDEALPWLDACLVLLGEEAKPPPLLGTGGNEGSMDFSINHLERLLELFDADSGVPRGTASETLRASLFEEPLPRGHRANPGFLGPYATGGANMGTGFEGQAGASNWDAVLALEGAVLFAAAATRRHEHGGTPMLAQPFTFQPSRSGHGGMAYGESARAEFWAPQWARLVSLPELRALLTEGRATLGRRAARSGLDMARAIGALGVERGLSGFERFAFVERRGQGTYVAAHLGHAFVRRAPYVGLVADLERGGWLERFLSFATGDNAAVRFSRLGRRLEDGLFRLAQEHAGSGEVRRVLVLLGEVQQALAQSPKARDRVPPVPLLRAPEWLEGVERDPAGRIALALASLHGERQAPMPLRAHLWPVHPARHGWTESVCGEAGGQDPSCRLRWHVDGSGTLPLVLGRVLRRRLWLAEQLELRDEPLSGWAGLGLADWLRFAADPRLDRDVGELMRGLALVHADAVREHRKRAEASRSSADEPVPAGLGLLKLLFTPDGLLRAVGALPEGVRRPVPRQLLGALLAGTERQLDRALQQAWRALRSAGMAPRVPLRRLPLLRGLPPRRVAAAMLVPLDASATGALRARLLQEPEPAAEATGEASSQPLAG